MSSRMLLRFTLNQTSRGNSFNCSAIPQRKLATTSPTNSKQSEHESGPKKPNLRQAAKDNRPTRVIVAVCALALVYMYPMIFKPLFGIDTPAGDQTDKMIELEKHRPSNMPAWQSPFGPKSD